VPFRWNESSTLDDLESFWQPVRSAILATAGPFVVDLLHILLQMCCELSICLDWLYISLCHKLCIFGWQNENFSTDKNLGGTIVSCFLSGHYGWHKCTLDAKQLPHIAKTEINDFGLRKRRTSARCKDLYVIPVRFKHYYGLNVTGSCYSWGKRVHRESCCLMMVSHVLFAAGDVAGERLASSVRRHLAMSTRLTAEGNGQIPRTGRSRLPAISFLQVLVFFLF